MSHATDMPRVADAAHAAHQFVKELLADEQANDFRLEEFQESADGRHWLMTVGFLRDETKQPVKWMSAIPLRERAYKIVEIEKATGRPVAMRNRPSD